MSEWNAVQGVTHPRCDLCNRFARWSHPLGGFRCDRCPKPKARGNDITALRQLLEGK